MNTKLMKATIGLTVLMLMTSACGIVPTFGSGTLITETRDVSGFTQVEVSGGGTLNIIQDGTESLTVETDDNVMQYITSEVRGGTLFLDMEFGMRSFLPSKLHFTLHVKDLNSINTSGSWEVVSASIQTGTLDIVISGSGKVMINALTADQLVITASGSSNLDLAGKVNSQAITTSGSGKYLAGDLQSTTANIGISGSGNVTVWVTENLTVDVSGSGNVSYYGNPQVSFDQSGSGNIHNLGEK
jgi:hypothetical protein